MSPPNEISQLTFDIDATTLTQLERLSELRQRGPEQLVLDALRSFIEREQLRLDFVKEGIEGRERYLETGLHVTNDEVGAWIEELEADDGAVPPTCHK